MTSIRTARGYWVLCLAILPLVIFYAFIRPWAQTADMWETAAAMRAISQDVLHPANPLLALPGDTSPRFTPYVIFWGALSRYARIDVFTAIGLAGVFNYLLFVTGLARWITRQTREPKLALFVLITMLSVAGVGYVYANAYQFGFFLESLAYVGTFTYGVCFHALAFLRKYLDDSSRGSAVGYALLSILAFLTHPITAAFLFVAALALLLADRNWKRIFAMQTVPLLSLACALIWPYFDYWATLTNGSTEAWFPAALFAHQIARMGTALVGLFIVGYFAYHRRHHFVVIGASLSLVIYAVSGAVKFLMGSRFLLYGAIFLHIAIAIYLLEDWPRWWKDISFRRVRTLFKPALVLSMFLPAIWFRALEIGDVAGELSHVFFQGERQESPAERFSFLEDQPLESKVVMAEDDTGWPVPALSGAKLVWQQKGDPLITAELAQRRLDAQRFFRSSLTLEERRALLARYQASYILMEENWRQRWDISLLQQMSRLASEKSSRGTVILYRVL